MGNSIVFVDWRVAEIESIISAMPPGTEVAIIDGASDGLDQIATYLQGRSGIDAIHIISHGSVGSMSLGSAVIDSAALATHASQLEMIGQSLTDSGDILLYGCNVAAGDAGVQFIGTLAQATGADIAASIDLTGSSSLHGNWVLEARVGPIEAAPLSIVDTSLPGLLTTYISDLYAATATTAVINQSPPFSWKASPSDPTETITYSFDSFGFFSPEQIDAAVGIFRGIEKIIDVRFVQDLSGYGEIRFGTTSSPPSESPSAWTDVVTLFTVPQYASVTINTAFPANLELAPGAFGYMNLLHEIGHALGLKHPSSANTDGAPTPDPYLSPDLDNLAISAMSYNQPDGMATSAHPVYPETFSVLDIKALQILYGKNSGANSGATTYVIDSLYPAFQTLWEPQAGTQDTIDASQQTVALDIDLHPASLSYQLRPGIVGEAKRPFLGIAFDSAIENAIGGSGNDRIVGNALDNHLTGGGGNDRFVFAASGNGVDAITDFVPGDLIQVGSFIPVLAQTFTAGNGSTVSGGAVQVDNSTAPGLTTLYVGTDSAPGADVQITLQGTYQPGEFGVDRAGSIVLKANTAPSFAPPAGDGIVTVAFANADDHAWGVTLQPNGMIVVVGSSAADFAVARLNADGSPDNSFDNDGKVTTAIGTGIDIAKAVAVQDNGQIVVAGDSQGSPDWTWAVVRYNGDGTPDNGFGTQRLSFNVGNVYGTSVAVQVDGSIMVGGAGAVPYSNFTSGQDLIVARYGFDGSRLWATAVDLYGRNTDDGGYVAIQGNGKTIVAGSYSNVLGLARLDIDGSLDPTFGGSGDGKSLVSFLALARMGPIWVQPDDKIVASFVLNDGSATPVKTIRFNADGSWDSPYGIRDAGGMSNTAFNGGAYGPNYQWHLDSSGADGAGLLIGDVTGTTSDFAVARYTAGGNLDPTFDSHPTGTLGGVLTYIENGSPIILDSNVQIYDAELSAQGSYSGASLSLARSGGANAQDVFSPKAGGSLVFSGGNLVLGGVTIGNIANNAAGMLELTFNANANQARINDALQQIAYNNNSDAPVASGQIDWTFNDGNTSMQGRGGALVATGSTTINITAVNDAPVNAVPAAQTVEQDTNLTITGISVADVDASVLRVSLSATHGVVSLSGTSGLSFTTGDGLSDTLVVFSGTKANVNSALHNLTYHSNVSFSGNDTLTLTTSDLGAAGSEGTLTVTDTIGMTVNAVADSIQSSVSYSLHGGSHNLTLTGNSSINGTGNSLDNVIIGNSGNNSIRAQGGSDHINGGAGFDTAEYSGNHSDYIITKSAGYGYTITDANLADGDDGTDTLFGVESMQFADGSAGLASRILERVGSPTIWIVSDSQRDFNGDGKADLWWKQANGNGALWVMDGTNTSTPHVVGAYGGWSVVDASSDYNGDGKADLSWHNTNGSTMQWINAADMAAAPGVGPDAGWPLT